MRLRNICVVIHRYAGLAIAGFLIVAGLTGSIIAFNHELDRWLNPGVLVIEPCEKRQPVETWVAAVEEEFPKAAVTYVMIPQEADEPATLYLSPRIDPQTGGFHTLAVNQAFVNPGTGEILGSRDNGAFRLDRLHLIPFLYTLHYSLHLGQWGVWLFGAIALVWFFDCFIGLYLALPRPTREAVRRALTVKWRGGSTRVNYDLHRAGGLWVWVILAVLAFSGVAMNLHEELFEPLMHAVSPMTPWAGDAEPDRENPASPMPVTVADAIATAERGAAEHALDGKLGSVWIDYINGLYHFGYHTDGDLMREYPGAWVSVKGSEILAVRPAGGHTIGDAIHDWQFPLHSGRAFGLTGRIIISITGLVVAMLSVTGVVIWWKKRRTRLRRKHAQRQPNTAPTT